MLHEPPASIEGEDLAAGYKTRVGIRLFIVYSVFFAGFVALNAFIPSSMGAIVLFGLNLAVVYGISLIIIAIVMGLIYNILCTVKERELNK